jgi:hypothetical protein
MYAAMPGFFSEFSQVYYLNLYNFNCIVLENLSHTFKKHYGALLEGCSCGLEKKEEERKK